MKATKDTELNELRTQLQLCKDTSKTMKDNMTSMKDRISNLLKLLFKDQGFLSKIQNFILNGVQYPNIDKNIQDQIGSKPSIDMSGVTKEVCTFFTYFNNIVDLHVQKILSVHSLKSDSYGAKVDIFHLFKAPLPEYDNESLLIEINKLFQVLFGYLNNPIESKKSSGITTKDPLMLNKTDYPIIIRILASLASTEFKDEYIKTEPRSFKNYPILDDLYEFEFLNALSVKFIEKNPDAKKLQIIAFVIKNYKPGPSTEYSIPITILAIKMIQLLYIKLNTDRFKTLRNYCTTVP